ncbi:sel1 repeat family protein [Nocardia sp. 2]|uniref:Sel1 repeat family protein n=1 Tax=Nocardia acididurans TaxID=2802282 RepID=A0ABS1MFQ8_9NOCA|nr:sel1 repeat family protein [Nocardia acididurans]MBL1079402.1 sel1 repeat family protein [Nocardia acididurans]
MTGRYQYVEWLEPEPTLADRYDSAEPVTWNGAKVYPMHSVRIGISPTTVMLRLRAAAPRHGVHGLGMGLAVDDGHVSFGGRQMRGVDAWSDAMSSGLELRVCPTGPEATITLTPVWVDHTDAVVSWAGNYGMLITRERTCTVLHCSTGVGPADFGELVVELSTELTPVEPEPDPEAGQYRDALYDLGVAMHNRGELEQACQLWSQAAGFGHLDAAYDLAVVRFRQGELAAAEHWWRTAADHGDVRAMAGLAAVLDQRGNSSEARVWRAASAAESEANAALLGRAAHSV